MKQLRFIPLDRDTLQILESGASEFEARFSARLGESESPALDAARQTVAFFAQAPRPAPWGAYLAIDDDLAAVVGTCAFKFAPNDAGEVEIAYFTFPQHEGRGYATRMAAELVVIAFSTPEPVTVIAHTLPERNASARVLEKNQFTLLGEVVDPEDGRVWRWRREKPGE